MAKPTSETDSIIEALLQQRAQYEQWLARLDSAADKAPPGVRQKVRADYESRLRGVIDQLRGHSASIAAELQRHQSHQSELDRERRHADEELAEAEVRHTVGEYAEDEWRRIADDSRNRLDRLRSELRIVGDEIARLAEVQALITTSPARPAEVARPVEAAHPVETPAPPPPPPPEPVVERAPPPPPAPEPAPAPEPSAVSVRPDPRSAPRPPRPREPEPAAPSDELAFLKSVSDEERKPAPAPRRPSNPGGASSAAVHQAAPGKPGAAGVAKTLKCGECGTLNRPTEWYCERCGAELAGI
ncbi:MAG TPA: zinc finger Ran-binding domain-containing protein [Gemmatimonadales bacterium]|jgi:hypothetical protein|nr:zinc finger Ran-binding domain-containing protein [Gemmatimonadales bacterium]